MNNRKLLVASVLSLSATAVVVAPTFTEAAATIDSVALNDGSTTFTVTFTEYSDAYLDGSGDLYNLLTGGSVSVESIGVASGVHVDYNSYVDALFDASDDEAPLDVLEQASQDDSNVVAESDVEAYQTIQGFDEDGNPLFDDVVVPEVISID